MASKSNVDEENDIGFTITQDEFLHSAENFIQKSDKLYDGWSLSECKGEKYLKLVTQKRVQDDENNQYEPHDKNQQSDNETAQTNKSKVLQSVMFLEYHVIYSVSYSVPVLYLRGYNSIGGGLRIDKLIQKGKISPIQKGPASENCVVHPESEFDISNTDDMPQKLSADHSYISPNTFSQVPHPLLFEPFYQLHPCHTSQWMKMMCSVKQARSNSETQTQLSVRSYIIIWLSFIGPFVGLSLDNKYMLA